MYIKIRKIILNYYSIILIIYDNLKRKNINNQNYSLYILIMSILLHNEVLKNKNRQFQKERWGSYCLTIDQKEFTSISI
jgi:hypothetical protein